MSKLRKRLVTEIINIKTYDGDDFIPIHRGTQWGNPFKIGKDGKREEVIVKYEKYIRNRPDLMADFPKLVGECLGCYCAPKMCHGNILVKLIRERSINNETKICCD